jgi:negative regulator of sigma E activity
MVLVAGHWSLATANGATSTSNQHQQPAPATSTSNQHQQPAPATSTSNQHQQPATSTSNQHRLIALPKRRCAG